MARGIWIVGCTLIFLCGQVTGSDSETLTLEAYLHQVKERHQGIRGALETSSGAMDRSHEGQLLLSPTLFANLSYLNDSKPTANQSFQGSKTIYESYSLGVAKLTDFGMLAKLYYGINYTSLTDVNPLFVSVPSFYEARPTLELTQSLWRNWFGRETRANQTLLEAQALATRFSESFRVKLWLAEAETNYWRLVVAKEAVTVQKESLARAMKIREWSQRRARLELADKADLLQAEAALQVRQLELQSALDEERASAKAFNSARSVSSDRVDARLTPLDVPLKEELKIPVRKGAREDVRAAEQQERAAVANAEVAKERNAPNLDLNLAFSLNGKDVQFSEAFNQSFQTGQPTFGVNFKFSAPLSLGILSADREGYAKEIKGAELGYQRKVFEESEEWNDLQVKMGEAKKRLSLCYAIESAQKDKLMHEKDRHRRGRSTTFQVLQFEQDYATAQLVRIKTQAEILTLLSRMKTFEGNL